MAPPELIPGAVPLTGVPGLSTAQIEILSGCWLNSAQELAALDQEPIRALVAFALGVDAAGLSRLMDAARRVIPAERGPRFSGLSPHAAAARYGRGALLEEVCPPTRRRVPPPYGAPGQRAALPASVSHLSALPPLRIQGARGTCVAHTVLAIREHLEIAAGCPHDIDLSEQFVYWWCKQHDGLPERTGTYMPFGMRCLAEVGAPLEQLWPYVQDQGSDEGQGPPPPAAANGDPAFRTLRTFELDATDITGIKTCLFQGRLVGFALPVFASWYYSTASQRWGKVTLPLPDEPADGGHAMAIVGYQDDPTAPGGGYFLVRNSWQPWAENNVWLPGYGCISYAYIATYAQGVSSAERLTAAPSYLRDSVGDDGARPLPAPTWNSPDIWLRRSADGNAESQPPIPGQPMALYVRGFNHGPAYRYQAKVALFSAPLAPTIAANAWQKIGECTAERLPPLADGQIFQPLTWSPPASSQCALQARLVVADAASSSAPDPATDSTIAQRNVYHLELRPGAAGKVEFALGVTAGGPGTVRLEVERGALPADVIVGPLGLAAQEDPPPPGQSEEAIDAILLQAVTGDLTVENSASQQPVSLPVLLPATARPGTRYLFAVVQRLSGQVTGRMTVQVDVSQPS